MTLIYIYSFLIIISFTFKKSKIVTITDFMVMWIMMGWSYGNADYPVYFARYWHPEQYGTLEPLYSLLQNMAKTYSLSYSTFLIVMSGIALLLRFISIYILTDRLNEVLGFWMIFPFIADINQIREFYATSLAFLGIAIFLRLKNENVGLIIAMILCFAAGMIHISALMYFILLIPYLWKNNRIKLINEEIISGKKSIVFVIFVCLLALSGVLNSIGGKLIGAKWSQTAEAASIAYDSKTFYFFEMILFFFLGNYILRILVNNKEEFTLTQNKIIRWTYIENYLLLIALAFAVITPDIYRVQQEFIIFIYCAVSYNFNNLESNIFAMDEIKAKALTVILAIIFLWLMCLAVPSLKESVFLPAFYDNLIFN